MTLTPDRLRYLDSEQLLMLHKAYLLGERTPEALAFLDAIMREQARRNEPQRLTVAA